MKARIRTVKPEAAFDEELWDLAQETGLPIFQAFVILWCHADRDGRFEWRPRSLGALCLPYWEGDFSRVLDALESRGFVVRYAVRERVYGHISTFKAHQFINGKEPESTLPKPPKESKPSERVSNGSSTGVAHVPDATIPSLTDPVPDPNKRSETKKQTTTAAVEKPRESDPEPEEWMLPPGERRQSSQAKPPPAPKIPCPADLQFDKHEDTINGFQMSGGAQPWGARMILREFAQKASQDPTDLRPLSAWRKCAIVAINQTWSDPARRPRRPGADNLTAADTVDHVAEKAEAKRAERLRLEAGDQGPPGKVSDLTEGIG